MCVCECMCESVKTENKLSKRTQTNSFDKKRLLHPKIPDLFPMKRKKKKKCKITRRSIAEFVPHKNQLNQVHLPFPWTFDIFFCVCGYFLVFDSIGCERDWPNFCFWLDNAMAVATLVGCCSANNQIQLIDFVGEFAIGKRWYLCTEQQASETNWPMNRLKTCFFGHVF